ncbi:hypothetical protein, partial [Pseudolysinimonas sp.]|uniref:nSTAND1 domain-containing NTPase n=1 Tax=Pseudolysinimonas sp. TaxID=2680009 RepID=UPI00286C4278
FEDLFQLETSERDRLVASLAEMLADGAALALSLRSDYLDRATGLDAIGAAIGAGVFALGPLAAAGIREAIERPARLAGLRLEPGLVEVVLREAGERLAALPHLSHALVETWARREGTTLTVDGYTDAGGIAGAIAISAEERFRHLDAAEQESCHSLMLRLIERDEAGGIVRRHVLLAPILGDVRRRRVIEQLVGARLLAIDGEWLMVAHEAVARAWPRLEGWLQDDAESAALLRRLESSAAAWATLDRGSEDLPRGTRLAEFLEWRDATDPDLTDIEREYLQAADAARRDELAEVTARVTRQRRQNRWLRIAFGVASGLLVIALVASSIAFFSQREAVLASEDARIEALAATAYALADSDLDAALLISAELHRRYPDDVRVRSALLGLLEAPGLPESKIMYPADQRIFSGVVPGTTTMLVASDVVAASDDGLGTHLTLWEMTDSTKIEELPVALPDFVAPYPGGIHVQESGTLAVVAYPVVIATDLAQFTSVLATVNLTTGELVAGPVEVPYGLGPDGVFIDDGATLVLRPWKSAAPIWIDVDTLEYHREGVSRVAGQTYPWSATTLLSDGTIAVGEPGWLHVYDPATRTLLRSVPVSGDLDTRQLQPVDDGMLLASGTDGVALIDTADGSVRWQFDHRAGCWQFEVLLERGTFVCVGGDHVERLLSDGALTGRSFPAQAEWIYQSDRLADGSMVVTNLRDTPFLQRFAIDGTGPISHLVAGGQMAADGFADDRTIVTTPRTVDPWNDHDGPRTLWDIVDDHAVGLPSDGMDVLGHGVVARWDDAAQKQTLETADGSRIWTLSGGPLTANPNVRTMLGSRHGLAFAIADG